ncbi:uncharacterized protein LOC110463222 isoform X2 [Mizuhopecten yessoensis]|uniref:Dystonin n=1 Tax=Mizuhopecten yessoensis TaxID=6573 RepID=A0A210PWP0_MIZYE|nr:uncharacterized protein LOC110463222 isoform X2 [Mizuhopecten yessoensis]OWF40872.1 Dystonin [Mizuhopecten yessoensis]
MWSRWSVQKKMAEEDVQKCMDWLFKTQDELLTSPFGTCQSDVTSAIAAQRNRNKEVQSYGVNLNKIFTKHQLGQKETMDISAAYESVKAVSGKKSSCLEVLSGIASLEDSIQSLSCEFDARSVHLVNMMENNKQTDRNNQSNENLARTAQGCVVAVRNNWRWINTVLQCSQVHLHNAASYQEFFHEVEEVEYWMNTTMSRIHLTFDRSKLSGDKADVNCIQTEMKDVLLAYLQWQGKVESLFDRAKRIVPVPNRIRKLEDPRPVIAIAGYKTSEIEFQEGETLTLLDNSDRTKWMVKNAREQTCLVPAVLFVIPGPSGPAIDAIMRLRTQLLALWTMSIKRLGYQMIAFMLMVFRDWSEEEIKSLQGMGPKDRNDLIRVMNNIEKTLYDTWNGYGDFKDLQERIARLRMILEEGDKDGTGSPFTAVVQLKSLDNLLSKYKDFWAYWETFKVIVELVREPKHLLVCDKWDQLRFVSTAHFVKFWDTTVNLNLSDLSRMDTAVTFHETPRVPFPPRPPKKEEEMMMEEVQEQFTQNTMTMEETGPPAYQEQEDESYEEYYEETVTESVMSSVAEERQTFTISSVKDPRTKNDFITPQEAVLLGIIDQATNQYVNIVTKETMTMGAAINRGIVQITFQSSEKIREEDQSYGLITIKTVKDTRPFKIRKVLDPSTEEELTVAQANAKNIIDDVKGTYTTEDGDVISIRDAIHSGLVIADFEEGENGEDQDETQMKTYAVHGVVNQRLKSKVSFTDAVDDGLLDRKDGQYVNNVTGDKVPVQEAIMRGFIKARLVTDTSKLDIDPSNNIVIDRIEKARSKILSAVRSAHAFKGLTNGKH